MKYVFTKKYQAPAARRARTPEQIEARKATIARYRARLAADPERAERIAARRREARARATARRIERAYKRCRICGFELTISAGRGRPVEYCGADSPNHDRCRRVAAALSTLQTTLPRIEWRELRRQKMGLANALNDIVRDNLGTGLPSSDYYPSRGKL